MFRINCNNCSCLELIMYDVMYHVCLGIRVRVESIWRRSVSTCAGLILVYIRRRTLYLSPPPSHLVLWPVHFHWLGFASPWQPQQTTDQFTHLRIPVTHRLEVVVPWHTVAVFERYPTRQALVLQKPVCVCVPFFSGWHQLEWRNCSVFEPHDGDTEPIQRSCSPG